MATHNIGALKKRAPKRSRMQTDPLALEVGAQIRALRTERGMSGKALAGLLKVPSTQLTAWERGRVVPSARSLLLLARALHCPAAALLPDLASDRVGLVARVERLPARALPELASMLAVLERAYPA